MAVVFIKKVDFCSLRTIFTYELLLGVLGLVPGGYCHKFVKYPPPPGGAWFCSEASIPLFV